MTTSQNGWPVDGRAQIASYQIPGGLVPIRKGDVAAVLVWCAQQWHQTVEPLVWPGCWGYADRTVRGSATVISNHASGTAIDLNAPAHLRGVPASATMSPAKIAAARAIVTAAGGVLRWGGDYRAPSQPDAMHVEINAGAAAVAALAARIRAGQVGAPASPAPATAQGDDVSWKHDEGAPPVPDYYPGATHDLPDPLTALGWAAAHGAIARDIAQGARADIAALRADLGANRPSVTPEIDYDKLAAALVPHLVAALLGVKATQS